MSAVVHASELDQEIFARELDSFIPNQVFDAHAHLWERTHLPPSSEVQTHTEEDSVDSASYRAYMAELIPGREIVGGLFLPRAGIAVANQVRVRNEFIAAQVRHEPNSRGSLLVTPSMDPDFVRQEVRRLGLSGLKCYHFHSGQPVTWNADIPTYLIESHVRVAGEEGLCITLHMVKPRAVADPVNQYWIRHYCETYPNMELILAHGARGFNPYHTIEGLGALKGLSNLWCDMSAVTEVGTCEAIIDILGHDRLLYGSDFPVSHLRGRCVVIGDQFLWLYEDTLDWAKASFRPLQPTLVGLESLRVLKQAAWHRHLTDSQVEDVFSGNARRLLGIH